MGVNYIAEIKRILSEARTKAYAVINTTMVEAYWQIGKRIVEEEQKGKARAGYGEHLINELSQELTTDFGSGFSARSIRQFRQFYQSFPDLEIWRAVLAKLNWTHIQRIMRISDSAARTWYLKEAAKNMWSSRTLDRNISTLYYQRLLSSQAKEPVENEMCEKTKDLQNDKYEFIKNPLVLEFLNLPNNLGHTEASLEQHLLNNIQNFMLELGKGFAFVAKQQLIRTETSDFYIDLVFYNYILKCFVLIDLKTDKMSHQDVGQLDMYVRMYDDLQKGKDDNPSIGILLCTETDKTIAKYSVLKENKQLFAAKYMAYLPTEEELRTEIEREKLMIKLKRENDRL
ncbi:PDDEXK nuclease domain-containing protein [Chitinophagaceae bacterium 26-R-25]|nr:PDDEXK nuclease domain-containing protein [Chitinophagaceae bacterium 26-R-25]